jgi:AraC family transcriptional regulator
MGSRLDGAVSLAELTRACDLSPDHFARAFKQTTGQPPSTKSAEIA